MLKLCLKTHISMWEAIRASNSRKKSAISKNINKGISERLFKIVYWPLTASNIKNDSFHCGWEEDNRPFSTKIARCNQIGGGDIEPIAFIQCSSEVNATTTCWIFFRIFFKNRRNFFSELKPQPLFWRYWSSKQCISRLIMVYTLLRLL